MLNRMEQENLERQTLAPYAALSAESRGREYPINACELRTDYMRDRDRIIHSAAFRKLEYKTQVYVIHEGDYYRTRLTHTMEVAQIARTMARTLRLNADLAEAIALAHDLGHTPFGHSGEVALNHLMEQHGGFEHNLQGIRVVETLEKRYADFPGLNLTFEVREGIAKHNTSFDAPANDRFEPHLSPPLEAQLVNVADEIAYNHHDLDDALKMGLLRAIDLRRLPWIEELCNTLGDKLTENCYERESFRRYRLVGQLLDFAIRDTLRHTNEEIEKRNFRSLDDVRAHQDRIVAFSPEMQERNNELRGFLMQNVYRHPHVIRMMGKGERIIGALFQLYASTPEVLPFNFQNNIPQYGKERVIADYI
ncbi:MAG: deoxyguanosinetriphosphate triphosphohydrolase, partial [Candidatus Sumerlaeota bacterium]